MKTRSLAGSAEITLHAFAAPALVSPAGSGSKLHFFAPVQASNPRTIPRSISVRPKDRENDHNYQVTSPPTVIGDLIVVGSSIGDNGRTDMDRGIVRGFDARTGAKKWSFDPLPAGLTNAGAANAWSLISADPARDLVFIPTGSASPDFYGGMRPGNNGYANSVVAIQASTGKVVWAFQVVHHDLWDYDVASQPVLVEFKGKPAVAVTTKIGHMFVLDRMTGQPLLPIEERAVPKSRVPGEETSPAQPFPLYDVMTL